jgi:hypothetical protein
MRYILRLFKLKNTDNGLDSFSKVKFKFPEGFTFKVAGEPN